MPFIAMKDLIPEYACHGRTTRCRIALVAPALKNAKPLPRSPSPSEPMRSTLSISVRVVSCLRRLHDSRRTTRARGVRS